MKKNIFFIILTLSLVACSSNKVDKESEQNKAEVISNLGESEKSDLDKLATHKESGVYHYKTFNTKDNSVISEEVYGISDSYEFRTNSNGIYEFRDRDTSTVANTKSNLYYQTNIAYKKDEREGISEELYNDLYQKGKFNIVKDDKYITIKFDNGDYRKYDSDSLDLIEETFTSEDMHLIRKLESHDNNVEGAYKKYIDIINNMQKVDDIGQVTKNE
ncbi:MAG: hypothetical protein E7D92_00880 [Anaerococcus sp.]|uniref:hypothetical protein n=1 Tax=Anaerococcus sp. TaxID=1872515 RepID=UPI0028FF3E67|nr:hypothetical protein [Anaerococcus sp.]MDU2353149.1 hypothetical protein [Anaerococcus sp.]